MHEISKLVNEQRVMHASWAKTVSFELRVVTHKDGTTDFLEEERPQKELNKNKCIVRLNDSRKTKWDLFVIFLAIYNSFQIPFEIAFHPD